MFLYRFGGRSPEILWDINPNHQPIFWTEMTSFLGSVPLPTDEQQWKLLIDELNEIVSHIDIIDIGFKINRDKHGFEFKIDGHKITEVHRSAPVIWILFIHFMCSFDEPTIPAHMTEEINWAGTLKNFF